jgi:hypothetical protein
MPRLFSIPLLLATCALCFVAGYKLGKESHPPAPLAAKITAEEARIRQLTDTGAQPPLAPQASTDQPVQHSFAIRAEETLQTFFDKDERKLVAQILEVTADSLKIRRQADGAELELPVAMLCAEDQAFAAYLWAQVPTKRNSPAKNNSPAASQSMEDKIWDELFK